MKLLDDEYLLLGDDRIVSDSRQVGAFKKNKSKDKKLSLDYGLSTLSKHIDSN